MISQSLAPTSRGHDSHRRSLAATSGDSWPLRYRTITLRSAATGQAPPLWSFQACSVILATTSIRLHHVLAAGIITFTFTMRASAIEKANHGLSLLRPFKYAKTQLIVSFWHVKEQIFGALFGVGQRSLGGGLQVATPEKHVRGG